jgi:hypothetical protein
VIGAHGGDARPGAGWSRLVRTNNNGCDSHQEHLRKFGDFQYTHSSVNLPAGPKPAQHLLIQPGGTRLAGHDSQAMTRGL